MADNGPTPSLHERVVLVGTALDGASDGVVAVAATWARLAGARLHVVHAFPPEPPLAEYEWVAPRVLAAEEDARRVALQTQLARLGLGPGGCGSTVAPGAPHEVLASAARRLRPILLVVGAGGARSVAALLGSTAERVVRQAGWPVLIVRPPVELPPRRVLAAVDLSPACGEGLDVGLELLRRVGGNEPASIDFLFVLHAIQRIHGRPPRDRRASGQASAALDEFVARHRDGYPGEIQCRVLRGDPRRQILRSADHARADLVMVVSHGAGGFRRLLVGNVTTAVMREARGSVLVLPGAPVAAAADDAPRQAGAEAAAEATVGPTN